MSGEYPDFLAHEDGDHVAVAVRDVSPGAALVGYLDQTAPVRLSVSEEVPLGHKVALTDVAEGEDVLEYGLRIAIASKDFSKGSYVHTHNVRSARWHSSVA